MLNVILRPTSCNKTTPSVHRKECEIHKKPVSIYYQRMIVEMPVEVIVEKTDSFTHFYGIFFFSLRFLVLIVMEPWNHVYF